MGVFPSSSKKPGKEIFITSSFYTNIDTYLTLKHQIFLLMHDLGHNLGLRHTDCFMKGEGNGSYGMVKIPNLSLIHIQSKPWGNLGSMENWGLEFELGWKDSIEDFSYWFNTNWYYSQNKLLDLGNASGRCV